MTAVLLVLLAAAVAGALLVRWHRSRPIECRCGHLPASHEHWRQGSDCGACGTVKCPHYRRAWRRKPAQPEPPVDLAAVCRDDELIEDVLHDRIDHAHTLADPPFVAALLALKDSGRAA